MRMPKPNSSDSVGRAACQLEHVAAALYARAVAAEAAAFRAWLLQIGDVVANASSEGSLGVGPPQANEREAAALARLVQALGTDAPAVA
jgi:hypothetical protein